MELAIDSVHTVHGLKAFLLQQLKYNFEWRAGFFKALHRISTTTQTNSRTSQILCKTKHSCENYTPQGCVFVFKKRVMLTM